MHLGEEEAVGVQALGQWCEAHGPVGNVCRVRLRLHHTLLLHLPVGPSPSPAAALYRRASDPTSPHGAVRVMRLNDSNRRRTRRSRSHCTQPPRHRQGSSKLLATHCSIAWRRTTAVDHTHVSSAARAASAPATSARLPSAPLCPHQLSIAVGAGRWCDNVPGRRAAAAGATHACVVGTTRVPSATLVGGRRIVDTKVLPRVGRGLSSLCLNVR